MADRKQEITVAKIAIQAFDVLSVEIKNNPEITHGLIHETASIVAKSFRINTEVFQICHEVQADYAAQTEDGQTAASITACYRIIFSVDEQISDYTSEKADVYLQEHPAVQQTAAAMFGMLIHKDLADLRHRYNMQSALPLAEITME